VTGALFALLTATKSSSGSSGTTFIIFLVLIALVGYFLLIRPQKQKQRRQREQQSAVGVGDEILTVGGIVGRVVAVDADRVTIVSGGDTVGFAAVGSEPTRLVLVRNAVARKIEPPLPDAPSDESIDSAEDETSDSSPTFNGHDSTAAGSSDEPAENTESEGTSS
jgi:preprotein translocase subunit YajC